MALVQSVWGDTVHTGQAALHTALTAFINFGAILLTDIDMVDSFFRTDFRILKIYCREISSFYSNKYGNTLFASVLNSPLK